MESFRELGNIEFLNCFLTLHYQMFGLDEDDIRIFEPKNLSKNYMEELLSIKNSYRRGPLTVLKKKKLIETLYQPFLVEALNRGLKITQQFEIKKNFICTEDFRDWLEYIKNNPTYIREIRATDFIGGYDIKYVDDETIGFDPPVREACKALNDKGYLTYWSSANYEDFHSRYGHAIKDKSVAYILIDSKNLSEELKEKLYLNGRCNFWGIAKGHNDNGKYYGIWAEITSDDMLCSDLNKELVTKALELPTLVNIQDTDYSLKQL